MDTRTSPTMLTHQQVDKFQFDGFLNAGPVLDEQTVEQLSTALNAVLAKGPDGFSSDEPKPVLYRDLAENPDQPVWQIVNIWEASVPFRRLISHPFIVRAIAQLTGFGDLQVWHDQVQYKPAGHGGATPWHQDAPLWPSIAPMTPVSAWIPFDDADEANGCMWMVPGSHCWQNQMATLQNLSHLTQLPEFKDVGCSGFAPPEGEKIEAVACPVKRREVHFHHSLTWHGSPFNQSNRPRRAIAIHYMTCEAVFTGRDHAMKQFISIGAGEKMINAGAHFPIVSRAGEPVETVTV